MDLNHLVTLIVTWSMMVLEMMWLIQSKHQLMIFVLLELLQSYLLVMTKVLAPRRS